MILHYFPLLAVFTNFLLGIYILIRKGYRKQNILYVLASFALAIWAGGDYFSLTSAVASRALIMDTIGRIGILLTGPFILHFLIFFTKQTWRKSLWVHILYLPAFFFLIINTFFPSLLAKGMELSEWGYLVMGGPLYFYFTMCVIMYLMLGLILCGKFYAQQEKSKKKNHAGLMFIGVLIPVLGGTITDIVLPLKGISAFPLASSLTVFTTIFLAIGISRFDLFNETKFTLQKKLTFLFFVFILILGVVSTVMLSQLSKERINEDLERDMVLTAYHKANDVQYVLDDFERRVYAFSASPYFMNLVESKADEIAIRSYLNEHFLVFDDAFIDAMVVSVEGVVQGSVRQERTDALHWKQAMDALSVETPIVWTDVYYDDILDKNVLTLVTRVGEERITYGYLVVFVSSDPIQETLYFHKNELSEGYRAYVVSEENITLFSTDSEHIGIYNNASNIVRCRTHYELFLQPDNTIRWHKEPLDFFEEKGTTYIGVHAYVPKLRWCVGVDQEDKVALAPVESIRISFLLIFLLFLVLSMIGAYYLAKQITKPIMQLRLLSAKVAKGDFDATINIRSTDELGDLAQDFKDMILQIKNLHVSLEEKNKTLEDNVEKRTKDLADKAKEEKTTWLALLNILEDVDMTNKDLLDAEQELRKNLKKLKELDKQKDGFISIAAHELKTPLTSIAGFIELLKNKKVFNDKEKREHYFSIIQNDTKRLGNLITDILDLSRIDLNTVKFAFDTYEIIPLIESVLSELGPLASPKNITLVNKVDTSIGSMYTDQDRFKQIIINMLTNAIKYSGENSKILLHGKGTKDTLTFAVQDFGVGMDAKTKKNVFKRFYQGDSSYTRKVGGVGLGMAIAYEFVKKLGGTISVTSRINKGTTFTIVLPRNNAKFKEKT